MIAAVAAVIVTALASFYADLLGIEFRDLSREPVTVVGAPNYSGSYANLTITLWQVPASCALLASGLLRRLGGHRSDAAMLLYLGLITAVMAIDDGFLLHETIRAQFGISQKIPPVLYTVAILAVLWVYRHRLRWTILAFVAAMGFWGVSAISDALDSVGVDMPLLMEDGAKMVGTAVWTYATIRVVAQVLLPLMRARAAKPVPADGGDSGEHRRTADLRRPVLDDERSDVPPRRTRPRLAAGAPVAMPSSPADDVATGPIAVVPPRRARDDTPLPAHRRPARQPQARVDDATAVHRARRPEAIDSETVAVRRRRRPDGPPPRNGIEHTPPPMNGHAQRPVNGHRRNGHRYRDGE
ncbi:hypothetical protein ACQEVB_02425 [Pseudonocardia sp. CA-107938]|uniref:hypothetical protein n=1 Tax=Pseudonocardia sp. CA-107938 TaxID=3240021 RepID=UPI003D8B3121